MRAMIRKLNEFFQAVSRIFGSNTLLPYEQLCMDAWRASLPEPASAILDVQLSMVNQVQRQAGGAKICFYYTEVEKVPTFSANAPDLHVAFVVIRSPNGIAAQQMRVKIFLHRGRFFSIEFPKRPDRYFRQHQMDPHQLEVDHVEHTHSIE